MADCGSESLRAGYGLDLCPGRRHLENAVSWFNAVRRERIAAAQPRGTAGRAGGERRAGGNRARPPVHGRRKQTERASGFILDQTLNTVHINPDHARPRHRPLRRRHARCDRVRLAALQRGARNEVAAGSRGQPVPLDVRPSSFGWCRLGLVCGPRRRPTEAAGVIGSSRVTDECREAPDVRSRRQSGAMGARAPKKQWRATVFSLAL